MNKAQVAQVGVDYANDLIAGNNGGDLLNQLADGCQDMFSDASDGDRAYNAGKKILLGYLTGKIRGSECRNDEL